MGQGCPYNIDFEAGTFDRWTCLDGVVKSSGVRLTPQVPLPNSSTHAMYTANTGDGVDRYGNFPVNCPNGSGHSIKLGGENINSLDPETHREIADSGFAAGISYDFTIPANQNEFTLTYNYALVLHDSPTHKDVEQAKFEVMIMDVADSTYVPCGYFNFNASQVSTLPGFSKSSNNPDASGSGAGPVWYKDWTSVTVNLSGKAGRKFRIFFKVSGCTKGAHFGYAYVDINSECTNAVLGSTFCPKDSVVTITAPYGVDNYTWYDSTLTKRLGRGPVLTFKPPPPSGTMIAVSIEPDLYYGCPVTTYIRLMDTLKVIANAGRDTSLCKLSVRIGDAPKYGFVYKWSPATGLSDPNISNPVASPATTTNYVLTVTPLGGGLCIAKDTVQVKMGVIDNTLDVIGGSVICNGGNAILKVPPTDSIQWYQDDKPVTGANQPDYSVTKSGVYFATLANKQGCSEITKRLGVYVVPSTAPAASFTTSGTLSQCLLGNLFSFTNTSINPPGVTYKWQMGDGTEFTTKDVSYTYPKASTYKVYLVSDNSSCTSSSSQTVQVYQNAIADFKVNPVCINLPAHLINNTVDTGSFRVNYIWNLGNGLVSNVRTPPPLVYSVAGFYPVSLSVNNAQCPSPLHTVIHNIVVDQPKIGIRYPEQSALFNIPLQLQARQIGNRFLWSPATSLDKQTTSAPVFTGSSDQLYTIEIQSTTGCITVDTQLVKIIRTTEIYVPGAFTPNQDGRNDFLKPITGLPLRVFKIYNRWGQLIFDIKDNRKGWDGRFKGIPQQTQTIVWMLEAVGVDGTLYKRSGTSTLIR